MPGAARLLARSLCALAVIHAAPLWAQVSHTGGSEPLGEASTPAPDPTELSAALLAHGSGRVAAEDLRAIDCDVVSQAPGALDCRWEQQTKQGWQLYTTWLAQVGEVWTVLDVPMRVPDFDRGKLKALGGSPP